MDTPATATSSSGASFLPLTAMSFATATLRRHSCVNSGFGNVSRRIRTIELFMSEGCVEMSRHVQSGMLCGGDRYRHLSLSL